MKTRLNCGLSCFYLSFIVDVVDQFMLVAVYEITFSFFNVWIFIIRKQS